ncbi:ABC transporter ATP-binding protein [Cellulomonas triticagri]|uniref:ABC transporter ATP-binding protein n=1 Tax=Cellulomonas triticagri TaxID=2483352 RepID=A0A3M2JHS4_9CELL|nr:ABC transporter ATP-binding protein [Cellulomonas triticagri]RMI13139.1 ABC transporter ATP-binding protein [Cellulomonas triticagri]
MPTTPGPVLTVEDLSVQYRPALGPVVDAVRHASLRVDPGELVGLAGESGSGKTTFAQAVLRLLRRPGHVTGGTIRWGDTDVTDLDDDALRPLRWSAVATVFQSSMNALNPVVRVRRVFEDVIAAHDDPDRPTDARERAAELFDLVSVDPRFLDRYPHELSGGMRQRVNLALALALRPRLVLFDEPTTGLDVVVQKSVLDKIRELQARERFGAVLITHDMGTLLDNADRVAVMYEGEVVEDLNTAQAVTTGPRHPYSIHLVGSYAELLGERVPGYTGPEIAEPAEVPRPVAHDPVVQVEDLRRRFTRRRGWRTEHVDAVQGVSFTLREGAVTALVGQSGSGKSTIARVLTRIDVPTSGTVRYLDQEQHRPHDVAALRGAVAAEYRRNVQYVFQDPYSALNPTLTVGYALSRPLANYHHLGRRAALERAADLLEQVGLTPAGRYLGRLPHQLSGGQRQRVVIARALAAEPRLVVADEPIASLDVSIRAEILEVLQSLVADHGVGMLYITHDLLSAATLADDVLVLREGALVESGPAAEVIGDPQADYTRELLDAIPHPFARRTSA